MRLQMEKFSIHSKISTGIKMDTFNMMNSGHSTKRLEKIWKDKDVEAEEVIE